MNTDRFKFRVWHPKYKHMFYNIEIKCGFGAHHPVVYMQDDKIKTPSSHGGIYHSLAPNPEIAVMHCTGLKDSEGKLIFESDIVEMTVTKIGEGEPVMMYEDEQPIGIEPTHTYTPITNIAEVRYRLRSGFVALVRSPSEYKNAVLQFKEKTPIKIIGNMYENPKLLTKKEQSK